MKYDSVNFRHLRMVLQKNTLLASRVVRTKWGPYTLGALQQGDFTPIVLAQKLKTLLFNYKKEQLANKQKEIQEKIAEANRIESCTKDVKRIEQQARDIKTLNEAVIKKKYPALSK